MKGHSSEDEAVIVPLCCCQECTQTTGDVVLHMFDPVTVQVSIDESNIQHQRLALKLVSPVVSSPTVYGGDVLSWCSFGHENSRENEMVNLFGGLKSCQICTEK